MQNAETLGKGCNCWRGHVPAAPPVRSASRLEAVIGGAMTGPRWHHGLRGVYALRIKTLKLGG